MCGLVWPAGYELSSQEELDAVVQELYEVCYLLWFIMDLYCDCFGSSSIFEGDVVLFKVLFASPIVSV